MRNIRFNKIKKFLKGGPVFNGQAPFFNLPAFDLPTLNLLNNLAYDPLRISHPNLLNFNDLFDAYNKIMAFGDRSENQSIRDQNRIMHTLRNNLESYNSDPVNYSYYDLTGNDFSTLSKHQLKKMTNYVNSLNSQLNNLTPDKNRSISLQRFDILKNNHGMLNSPLMQDLSRKIKYEDALSRVTHEDRLAALKEIEREDDEDFDVEAETAKYTSNSTNDTKSVIELTGASESDIPDKTPRDYGAIGKTMERGLDISLNLMYAIGSNLNDSKGTNIARGAVATGAEIASLLPPPANMAAPILKGINLADSILDKAHVGKYNDNFQIDLYTFEKVGGSYGSTLNAANDATQLSGQRHGFLGIGGRKARKRDNAKIAEAKRLQNIMSLISNENDDLKNGAEAMSDENHILNQVFLSGGYDPAYARALKNGGTLTFNEYLTINNLNEDLSKDSTSSELSFSEYLDSILQFKSGGVLKSPNNIDSDNPNVIPEGALHKNKHNLKAVGYDDSEITKKGIPVVDSAGNLLAEIELNEIIFNLEVTQFLEENYKKFYEDSTSNSEKEELAFNVGKELIFLILHNTNDNTGLIEVAKDGTSLQLKYATFVNDDSAHSFLEENNDSKNPKLKQNIEKEDTEFNPYMQEFIKTAEALNYSPNYIENMLIHCIKESSWDGNHKQTKNNFSNIHVSKNWKGLVYNGKDTNASGIPYKILFKDYDTMEEFIKDHDDTLKRLYGVTLDDDFNTYIDKIDGNNKYGFHWAESPTYREKLQDIFKRFRSKGFLYYIY